MMWGLVLMLGLTDRICLEEVVVSPLADQRILDY